MVNDWLGERARKHATARSPKHPLFTTPAYADVAAGYNLTKIFRKFDLKMDKKRGAL